MTERRRAPPATRARGPPAPRTASAPCQRKKKERSAGLTGRAGTPEAGTEDGTDRVRVNQWTKSNCGSACLSLFLIVGVVDYLGESALEQGERLHLVPARRLRELGGPDGDQAAPKDLLPGRPEQSEQPEVAQAELVLLALLAARVAAEHVVDLTELKHEVIKEVCRIFYDFHSLC